ncbi:hypothetical protein Zmor_012568 [Zophobas morio]|uniref:Uncharacterized protein n=1 Tax=Zophobas morio TaxID=2755281 RepID=A0AA38IGB3_9CUCU|nr:hypothetical protein Zmor_012568 [Zophobas morio]
MDQVLKFPETDTRRKLGQTLWFFSKSNFICGIKREELRCRQMQKPPPSIHYDMQICNASLINEILPTNCQKQQFESRRNNQKKNCESETRDANSENFGRQVYSNFKSKSQQELIDFCTSEKFI